VIVVLLSGGKTSAGWNSSPRIVFAKVRETRLLMAGRDQVDQIRSGYGLDLLSVLLSGANFPPSADVTGRTAIGQAISSNFSLRGVKFIYD